MKAVLITGGSGFVGHWMHETRPQGIAVASLNRIGYEEKSWMETKWEAIIHLAPVGVEEVIIAASMSKCPILFASSGAAVHQRNEYGRNKAKWEMQLMDSRLDVKIARLYAFCGAKLRWERFAIGSFISDAERGIPIRVAGDGTAIRTFMYGSDLGEWMWKILLNGSGLYDVGADQEVTIKQLAEAVAKNYSPTPAINVQYGIPIEIQPRYVPDTQRAKNELGLTIKVGFEEAIKRTIASFREEMKNGEI